MTSEERREARYQRRKAERAEKRQSKLSQFDSFERVTNIDNLYASFLESKSGVDWKESVQRYEANALRNIIDTRRRLLAGESVQHGFMEFTLHERGKVRHIKSVHISERVVQKCLCNQALVPILSNGLIYDNGASVKGKGVHFAIKRLIAHLSMFYRQNGNSNEGYCLSIDFSKFFDSIDHELLFKMLDKEIKDKRVLDLTKKFIAVFGDGKSLGLGSQVSQIAAIYFPSKVDHFVKDFKGEKFYGRYMDDLYIIHHDKEHLEKLLTEIETVCTSLKITINKKKTRIVKLASGMEFLKGKYILLSSGKILRRPRKDSTKRTRRKLKKFRALIDLGKMDFKDLRTAYQSWRGNYKKRFDAYHRVRFMDKLYSELFIAKHTL
jgi:retron-type reverse transcriptase